MDILWKICILSIISDNISSWNKSMNLKMYIYGRLHVTCHIIIHFSNLHHNFKYILSLVL